MFEQKETGAESKKPDQVGESKPPAGATTKAIPLPKAQFTSEFNALYPSLGLNRSPEVSPPSKGAFPWIRSLNDIGVKFNFDPKHSLSVRYFALNEVERKPTVGGVGAFGINRLIVEHSSSPVGVILEQHNSEQERLTGLQVGFYGEKNPLTLLPVPKNLKPDYGWAYVTTGGTGPGEINPENPRIVGFVMFAGKVLPKGFEATVLLDFRKSIGATSPGHEKSHLHNEDSLFFPKIDKLSNGSVSTRPYFALFTNSGNKFLDPWRVQGGLQVQFLQLNTDVTNIFHKIVK